MAKQNISQRREENLRAMRSPASIALAGMALVAVICAIVFYDKPISDSPVIFSQFRSAPTNTVH